MKKLFLIDAYALIFRYYYAFHTNPFRNVKGENVSSVFGFVKFLYELIERENPHHLGVAFDPKGGNFRHQLYPDYKANREETPTDIVKSVPIIKNILQAMRIPILEVEGFEADDVIGTISYKASQSGDFQTFMVTPDKDFGQLIRPNVSIYRPAKGGTGVEVVGMDRICEVYGISDPIQVIDILALWGDASDNIPGVAGIGEKTACKLVAKYGDVENIVENAHELSPRMRSSILESQKQLALSKVLATISLDVPIEFEPEKLIMEAPKMEELSRLYLEQGFNSFLSKIGRDSFTEPRGKIAPAPKKYSEQRAVQGSLFDVIENEAVKEISEPQQAPFQEYQTVDGYNNISNTKYEYVTVDNMQQISDLATSLASEARFCFDTETTSLDPLRCELVGISFATEPHKAWWIPLNPSNCEQRLAILRPLFYDDKIAKIGHNIKYDILVLRNHNLEVRGELIDTMLLHYLLNPESVHSMDFVSRMVLNYNPIPIENLIGKGAKEVTMDTVDIAQVAEYGAEDADITLQLYLRLWNELKEEKRLELYNSIEEPLIHVLANMEFTGVRIDVDILGVIAEKLKAELAKIEEQIRDIAEDKMLNINSTRQLGELLFERLKIVEKPKFTKTKLYKTDEETLAALRDRHPVVGKILEYRGIKKLLSTYIETLPLLINPATGRVHTSFNQAVTSTGRLSSTNPNLQNIPVRGTVGREIRRAFVAQKEGWVIVSADYSQVELRVMAHLSGDKNMIAAFANHEDIHTATAAKIYNVSLSEVTSEQRRKAKTANFGIIYGISAFGLSQRLLIPRQEAKELIDSYFELYPQVKQYMDDAIAKAQKLGYVETIFGRRRYLADINSGNSAVRSFAERNAINAPIQGSAADIMKIAMINVDKEIVRLKLQSKIIMQVHDEILVEAPSEELEALKKILLEQMGGAAKLAVPLDVDMGVGDNWLEAH